MKTSGLRGRGGAGYPSWLKWSLARNRSATKSMLFAMATRAIPAPMDRSVLEGDPLFESSKA